MKAAQKTDIGRNRVVNEDRALVETCANGMTLAVVADGMGGHRAGDTASQLTIDTFQSELSKLAECRAEEGGEHSEETYEEFIKQTIAKANDRVYQTALTDTQYHGMGTTIVLAVAMKHMLHVAHIGDSRAYKLSGGELLQLTEDHSLVNELLKTGQISLEQAKHHPRRNVLTRALGTEKWVQADICQVAWKPNDMLLLCSDGLSSHVSADQIKDALSGSHSLDDKADHLVQLALDAGGDDNITVILLANEAERAAVQEE